MEGLFAGFVIGHLHIQSAVLDKAVQPVDLAAEGQAHPIPFQQNGRVFFPRAEGHLKGNGPEFGQAQLLPHILHNGHYHPLDAAENGPEPGTFLLQMWQGLFLHLGDGPQGGFPRLLLIPLFQQPHRPLHHIVKEGAGAPNVARFRSLA